MPSNTTTFYLETATSFWSFTTTTGLTSL